jgi:translation initiation factor IF-3
LTVRPPTQYLIVRSVFTSPDEDDDFSDYPEADDSSAHTKRYIPPTNDQITLPRINLIDINGDYFPSLLTLKILNSFDRSKYILVLVSPSTSTARLLSIADFRRHQQRRSTQDRHKKNKAKEIQITWNIGESDLMYRLKRSGEYLSSGYRVSIIIGARKNMLTRNRAERDELLTTIRTTLKPFGKEWRETTGGFPSMELWFEPLQSATVEEEKEDVPATTMDTTVTGDDKRISREELKTSSLLNRDARKKLLNDAEQAYMESHPQKQVAEQTSPEEYWEKLASVEPSKGKKPVELKKEIRKPLEQPSREVVAAREQEFNVADPERLRKQKEMESKLRNVATQFSKLGTGGSILGRLGKKH